MASYYKKQIEAMRYHRDAADRIQEELNSDLEALFDEGLVARPSDEDAVKATGKYLQKLVPGALVSAADVKANVPSTRDLTHRGITAIINAHPSMVETGEKDQHFLKQFRRVQPLQAEPIMIAPAAD